MKVKISQYDRMTKTSIPKLIISLSIPTVLSMLATTIYNLVDTAFVGTLGTSASGAVGVVFGFMSILQAVGFMCGQGSGSLISRHLGQKNNEEATSVASTGFFLSFFTAIIISMICFIFVRPLVRILGSTPTIEPYAVTYIRCILATAPFVVSTFTLNNILRYEGKAKLAMIGLLSGGILNIGGDALFMFYFKWGIFGAGLSTAISQVISFCFLLSMFLFGKTQTKISLKYVTVKGRTISEIALTGFPSMIRQGLSSLSTIVINFEAASFSGDSGVAAMSIVSRASFLLFAIALGIGQGFQPVCGYNYGAGKYKRLKSAYKFTLICASTVLCVLTLATMAFSGNIIKIFRDDPEVIVIGTRALRILCIGQLFLPICMVTEMLMQASGKKTAAAILSSLRGGLIFIPLLLILPIFRGMYGVEEAQPLAFILSSIPAAILAKKYFSNLPNEDKPDEADTQDINKE